MKRILLISALSVILIALTAIVLAQKPKTTNMDARWKKVEEFAAKDLPESALKEVESILSQAKKENNSPQIIKALVNKMRFILDKNPDETEKLIREFEAFTESSKNELEKAVMHSMTAELYQKYYEKDQYQISRRTELSGFLPEDMKEWTKSIFLNKILLHNDLALKNPELLQKTPTSVYEAIIILGKDSRILQPTMFDFLAKRNIDMLTEFIENSEYQDEDEDATEKPLDVKAEILDTYYQLINFHEKDKNFPALVYTELSKLSLENPIQDERYLEKLNELEKKYSGHEAVVEILAAKANYYLSQENEQDKSSDLKKKAYDVVSEGLKKYPKYSRIALLENIKTQILNKSVTVDYKSIAKPGSKLKLTISSNNVSELKLSVYRLNVSAVDYQIFKVNRSRDKALYPNRKQVETRDIQIKPDPNFNTVKTELEITAGDYGIYEFVLEETDAKQANEKVFGGFVTTDFSYIQRSAGRNSFDFFVLDRMNGNPLNSVQVKMYSQEWNGRKYAMSKFVESLTNSDGMLNLDYGKEYKNFILFLEKGNDRYFSSVSGYGGNYYEQNINNKDKTTIDLFTDRSLYRPGQTLYFKGIMYKSASQEVLANQSATVQLFNANNERVGQQTLKTNEFGSFAGEFILPESGLNGSYRLQSGEFNTIIFVEEYKRPTFEVTVNKPKEEVRFGEKLTLTGDVKAFAGYAISDADVKYRVVRRPHRFWWWYDEPERVISSGSTKSDENGQFTVSFLPEKPKVKDNSWWRGAESQFYTYYIYADVTDPKGETQSGEQSISVGDKSLFILVDMATKVDKSEPLVLDVSTQTLNGETVQSNVKYALISLKASDEYYENLSDTTELKEEKTVLSGSFETKDKLKLDLSKFTSGMYKLVFTCKDNRGNEVKEERRFVLFDTNDKRPPVKMYSWLIAPKTEALPNEKVEIKFGTSAKNAAVLYEIAQGKTVLERRWITFNDEIKTFVIPFKESYGAGVTAMFTFVKDENIFTERVLISRKVEEKKLMPSVGVFRDKLKPGEKAEWTFHIPKTDDAAKQAELLVGMYDASLDMIRPHSWRFNPVFREFLPGTPNWMFRGIEKSNSHAWYEMNFKPTPEYQFDELNWFDLPLGMRDFWVRSVGMFGSGRSNVKQDMMLSKSVAKEEMAMDASADVLNETVVMSGQAAEETNQSQSEKSEVKVRENFNETAIFYPQLHTDKDGNVKISFTAPESLTRWNVKILAHTKDLYFGQNELQAITQKELMVQMNLPRFIRKSDKLSLAANVVNLTEETQTVNTTLEIINPETDEIIQSFPSENVVTLEPKATKSVEWQLNEMKDFDLLVVKVIAQNANFSDGEQKYLPVLPDKVLITESQAITVRANESRTFSFDSFIRNFGKVDTRNFAVEFASNPAWYAVQALPTLAEPKQESAIDYMTAFYANSLASYIANANPKLKSVFDQWKNSGGSRDAFLSNLEKNQELKNMLLDETPWIAAANDESEQKRRIALLFDLNKQENQSEKFLKKMFELQLSGGGFSWYKGMQESRYITQEILLNLARLEKMTKSNLLAAYSSQINKALNYLDLQIAKDFAELKKQNKNYQKSNVINNLQLFYLHTRSEYRDVPIAASAKSAVEFYTAQSEKYWTDWTLFGKAMMATVAKRNGKTSVANAILKSLKENALQSDELGMYWAKNTGGWWWHERPIATQTAIIEAVSEISSNQKDVDEMKIWLLKQKQTQIWDTPISTVDAIYALLNYGSDWISSTVDAVITLGNTELKPQSKEAGTGYFKETIPVANLKPEMGKITVATKNSNTIGWGAAYWQYYQDLDQVSAQGKEMQVSKKLFVEKMQNGKKVMQPIEQNSLKKGDKVITRIVLTTDRDMEFVALKDLRAACFEPITQTSGYQWKDGAGYYYTIKDASTQYFFDFLRKGTYVFEYEVWVNNTGNFTSGITSVQCQYAPEFVSHSKGEKIAVK